MQHQLWLESALTNYIKPPIVMKNTIFIWLLCLLLIHIAKAQVVDPLPGNNTVCAKIQLSYSVSPPANGCGTYTWVITNGSFPFSDNKREATGNTVWVAWDDVAAKGKLKVTVTCGKETYEKEYEYVIASLKGNTQKCQSAL